MAYIGALWPGQQSGGRVVDTFTVTAGAGPYTLSRRVVGGDPADIEVFLDNVRQQPTSAYTIGGTGNDIEKQITFSAAPTASTAFYVVHQGVPTWEQTTADGSVSNLKLSATAITGHTAETTVADDDVILMYDTSASALRKITRANFKSVEVATTLNNVGDVTITSNSSGEILKWNGSAWINNTLAEAGIETATIKDADNNTKIQVEESADENKIRFDTAGTERMIIAADGKVGIGTTSPSQPLHIKHPSGGTYFRLEDGSSSYKYDLGVENGQGNAFVLNDANANAIRMVVKTDGKVGIGTTNPTRQMELKGATENAPLVIDTASGSHAGVWFKENGTDRWQIYSVSSSGDLAYFNYGTSSESMRIKADGKVGIGTSSPSRLLHVKGGAGSNYLRIDNSADGHDVGFELYQNNVRKWEIVSDDSESDALVFRPGGQEKIRMKTDGTLMVNTTSQLTGAPFFEVHGANSIVAIWNSKVAGSSQQQLHSFYRNGQVCGHIHVTGNSVSYATSSDYRLKENVTELVGAIDRIKQFKPYRFNFIDDGPSRVVDGFVAHEVSEIVPESISGEKDAMRTEEYTITPAVKNETGNITTEAVMGERDVPDYQGIDQAKLVPLTIAALQEALAKIETLEAKVAALEVQ